MHASAPHQILVAVLNPEYETASVMMFLGRGGGVTVMDSEMGAKMNCPPLSWTPEFISEAW